MEQIRKLRRWGVGGASAVAERCLQGLGLPRPSALLLLAHMRSGSTLLLHLLMGNPEIGALGERNVVYASRWDLARLANAVRRAQGWPPRRLRYVVDQVNHNHLTPNEGLMLDTRIRLLFLLREPEAAIASLLKLTRDIYRDPWPVAKAADYYTQRLAGLVRLGQGLGDTARAGLIHYESLTDCPEETLESVRNFLGLSQGFSDTYPIHAFTRTRGDPGPVIASGRVVRERLPVLGEVQSHELASAQRAYRECRTALSRFALRPE